MEIKLACNVTLSTANCKYDMIWVFDLESFEVVRFLIPNTFYSCASAALSFLFQLNTLPLFVVLDAVDTVTSLFYSTWHYIKVRINKNLHFHLLYVCMAVRWRKLAAK